MKDPKLLMHSQSKGLKRETMLSKKVRSVIGSLSLSKEKPLQQKFFTQDNPLSKFYLTREEITSVKEPS